MKVEIAGDATLYLGDCRSVLPTLSKIDAIVTDPPYGIGGLGHRGGGRLGSKWKNAKHQNISIIGDDVDFDPKFLLAMGVPIVLWGANFFSNKLPKSGWLVWDKRLKDINFDGGDAELAYCSTLKTIKIERHLWHGVCRASEVGEHWHPTQKPVAVMKRCIELMGKAETILDPYMGSGTTGVAAIKMRKKFIGVEIEPKYFEIARDRIRDAQNQLSLDISPNVERGQSR